jgi:hypothetical protein
MIMRPALPTGINTSDHGFNVMAVVADNIQRVAQWAF